MRSWWRDRRPWERQGVGKRGVAVAVGKTRCCFHFTRVRASKPLALNIERLFRLRGRRHSGRELVAQVCRLPMGVLERRRYLPELVFELACALDVVADTLAQCVFRGSELVALRLGLDRSALEGGLDQLQVRQGLRVVVLEGLDLPEEAGWSLGV